jgi:SiaC family regulatory phosphoprotein
MIAGIHIPESRSTPEVHFDLEKGIYLLRGRSIPADASSFFHPLEKWVEALNNATLPKSILIKIRLEHLNTGTIRALLNIFSRLLRLRNKGTEISFEWFYEENDEDLIDKGEEMSLILDVPFKYTSFSDENY